MPKSRIILALGFFIALLPSLGFPNSWNEFFQVASGLLIVLLSVLISVDRRLTLKSKAEKRQQRKRAAVEASLAEVDPALFGRRETDHNPDVPVFGRRASDIVPATRVGRRASDRRIPVRDGDSELPTETDNSF